MKLFVLMIASALMVNAGAPEMLARAVGSGDLEAVRRLLDTGVDPNARTAAGDTALSIALNMDQQSALELLLAAHADPNAPLHNRPVRNPSYPALEYAARAGYTRAVFSLIAAGADVNARGPGGRTALHLAVEGGRYDVLHLLLQHSADVNLRDDEGAAPIDDAIWRGLTDAVALLIAHGARVDDPDPLTGATPINEAAYRGFTPIVQFLLAFHPDLQTVDKKGHGPIVNAILMHQQDTAILLLKSSPEKPPLLLQEAMHTAVSGDHSSVVDFLLANQVSANGGLPGGYTPLTAAAWSGSAKALDVLLTHGADPNLRDANRSTPLENASLKGFTTAVDKLVAHGAEINFVNVDSGATALYAAASFGKLPVVKLLLEKGADPAICANRKTPWQAAKENGFDDVANELGLRAGGTCRP